MAQLFISQLSQRKMLFQYLKQISRHTRQAKKLTYLDFLSPASDKAGYTKEWKKQPPVYRKQTKAQIKAGAKKSVQIPASWYISYTPISKYEKAQKTAELFQRKWKYKTAELIA